MKTKQKTKSMKIKLNLAETYFIKWVMESFLSAENKKEENKLLAKDILNKIKK